MQTTHICPMCEKGQLIPKIIDEEYIYKDQTYTVKGIECTDCPVCGSEITTPEQIKRNEIRVMEAKRKLEGFLSANEIKALREKFNLTQEQAANIFGGGANAFSKYERSEVMQSAVMDKLMRLALNVPECFEKLREMSHMPELR